MQLEDESDLVRDLAELFHHGGGHVVHGHHAGEVVRVGEEISLKRARAGSDVGDESGVVFRDLQEIVGGTEARGFDGAGNVEHGVALGHDHGVEINVAAAQALLNIDDVRGLVEKIFAGLQRL